MASRIRAAASYDSAYERRRAPCRCISSSLATPGLSVPGTVPMEPFEVGPYRFDQAVADHAVGEKELVERARIERGLDDALAALVQVAGHDQDVAADRRQRRDLGAIVALAVLVRRRDGNRAPRALSKLASMLSARPLP